MFPCKAVYLTSFLMQENACLSPGIWFKANTGKYWQDPECSDLRWILDGTRPKYPEGKYLMGKHFSIMGWAPGIWDKFQWDPVRGGLRLPAPFEIWPFSPGSLNLFYWCSPKQFFVLPKSILVSPCSLNICEFAPWIEISPESYNWLFLC